MLNLKLPGKTKNKLILLLLLICIAIGVFVFESKKNTSNTIVPPTDKQEIISPK